MTCVKCGREIPDGELFCPACSRGPRGEKHSKAARPESHPAVPKKGGARLAPKPEKKKREKAAAPARPRAVPVLAILLAVMTLAAAAAFGWILMQRNALARQRNAYQVHEADLVVREEALAAAQSSYEETSRRLAAAQAESDRLAEQIESLQEQISGNENALYQSEYDMTALQQQIDQMTQENTTLTDQIHTLEDEISQLNITIGTLQTDVETLTDERDAYQVKSDFLDAHVVFVENDNTNYYHNFECEKFVKKSYWCYSRRLAESRGYEPCPLCGG